MWCPPHHLPSRVSNSLTHSLTAVCWSPVTLLSLLARPGVSAPSWRTSLRLVSIHLNLGSRSNRIELENLQANLYFLEQMQGLSCGVSNSKLFSLDVLHTQRSRKMQINWSSLHFWDSFLYPEWARFWRCSIDIKNGRNFLLSSRTILSVKLFSSHLIWHSVDVICVSSLEINYWCQWEINLKLKSKLLKSWLYCVPADWMHLSMF